MSVQYAIFPIDAAFNCRLRLLRIKWAGKLAIADRHPPSLHLLLVFLATIRRELKLVSETNELQRNISVKDRYESHPFSLESGSKTRLGQSFKLVASLSPNEICKITSSVSGIPWPLSRMDAILWHYPGSF